MSDDRVANGIAGERARGRHNSKEPAFLKMSKSASCQMIPICSLQVTLRTELENEARHALALNLPPSAPLGHPKVAQKGVHVLCPLVRLAAQQLGAWQKPFSLEALARQLAQSRGVQKLPG